MHVQWALVLNPLLFFPENAGEQCFIILRRKKREEPQVQHTAKKNMQSYESMPFLLWEATLPLCALMQRKEVINVLFLKRHRRAACHFINIEKEQWRSGRACSPEEPQLTLSPTHYERKTNDDYPEKGLNSYRQQGSDR